MKLRKFFLRGLVLVVIVAVLVVLGYQKLEATYQHDMDIVRLKHLEYYGEILNEYHKKNGKYSFQNSSDIPTYVHIATEQQAKYIEEGPPSEHNLVPWQKFKKELEKGLNRNIEIKFEPQKVPVGRPNFYIYMTVNDVFFFAVHLHNGYGFARKVSKDYYKVELTNSPNESYGQWEYEALIKNKEFIKVTAKN